VVHGVFVPEVGVYSSANVSGFTPLDCSLALLAVVTQFAWEAGVEGGCECEACMISRSVKISRNEEEAVGYEQYGCVSGHDYLQGTGARVPVAGALDSEYKDWEGDGEDEEAVTV